jgi:GAF domain-containing protein
MPSRDVARAKVVELRQRAVGERQRAARAAAIAAEYEARRALTKDSLQPLRVRMADLHRRLEARHLEAARLQELHAARLEMWARRRDPVTAWPTFIEAVASAVGVGSTAVIMLGSEGVETLVAASDRTARLAHDVEFVIGEGPAHDVAASSMTVRAQGDALVERWPRYGPIVADHGVGSLISLPLRQEPGGCLGALSIYSATATVPANVAATSIRVADALTHTVLNVPGTVADDEIPAVPMFDESDFLAKVHQAAGMVSVQQSCETEDAVAMLRARAFADGLPLETLADHVIHGDVRL